jgi:hypothetical protein
MPDAAMPTICASGYMTQPTSSAQPKPINEMSPIHVRTFCERDGADKNMSYGDWSALKKASRFTSRLRDPKWSLNDASLIMRVPRLFSCLECYGAAIGAFLKASEQVFMCLKRAQLDPQNLAGISLKF